jgi:gentisate 1,2-dioxygenase
LLRYPYEAVDESLDRQLKESGVRSATVEYVNPATGGPAIGTITCEMTRVSAGGHTEPQRQTGGRIYVVFRGRGRSVIGGTNFEWSPGDVFVVPSWVPVEHAADEASDLFVGSDASVLQMLQLFREEVMLERQPMLQTFEPRTAANTAA